MQEDTVLHFNSGTVFAETSRGRKDILSGIAFDVKKGEKLALLGRTGSGKTMTALEIMGLLPENVRADGASVELPLSCRKPSERLGRDIVYIPQSGGDYLDPSRKVKKQLKDNLKISGRYGREELERLAEEKLKLAGFEDPGEVADRYPFELSGGMNQRVCIAIAACADPCLIIADEPTNGLDEKGRRNFTELLDRVFPEAGKIIITHDPELAKLCGAVVYVGERYEL